LKEVFYTIIVLILLLSNGCLESIEPEFDLIDDLLLIEGFALTEPGLSYVNIRKSATISSGTVFKSVVDAEVVFEQLQSGERISLSYDTLGFYYPPQDFAASSGDQWQLLVSLADGRTYESTIELATLPISVSSVKATYREELVYDEGFQKFVPGHKIEIDFIDPEGEKNYYLWKTRSLETQIICTTCYNGRFRDDMCQGNGSGGGNWYFDYLCAEPCWNIRFGDRFPIFDDRTSDGQEIKNKEIADIVLYKKVDILVEVQQYTINEATYKYFKTVDALLSESSGLNAPTPAALLGNIVNVDNPEEIVLGQFSSAGVSIGRVMIPRVQLDVQPVDPDQEIRVETCAECPQSAPCKESRTRTVVKPIGWE